MVDHNGHRRTEFLCQWIPILFFAVLFSCNIGYFSSVGKQNFIADTTSMKDVDKEWVVFYDEKDIDLTELSFSPSCNKSMNEHNKTFCCLIVATPNSQHHHNHTKSVLNVHVRVWNPEHPIEPLSYSVIGVSQNKYTISGLAVKIKSLSEQNGGFIDFVLPIKYPGQYDVLVHYITGTGHKAPNIQVDGSPMKLSIPPNTLLGQPQPPSPQLPTCQSLDGDSFVSWKADWIGPEVSVSGNAVLRTGWSLVPHKCRMSTFDQKSLEHFSLRHKKTPKTIAVFGTSRERGVFLTIVDKMLHQKEKMGFEDSEVGKCWGRASVKLNGLQVLYQDLRPQFGELDEQEGTITCHGSNIAQNSGYLQNATKVLEKIFEEEKGLDVLLLYSACIIRDLVGDFNGNPLDCMNKTKYLMSFLPQSWNGTVYLTSGFIQADAPFVTALQYKNYARNLRLFSKFLNDERAIVLDMAWALDMKLSAEKVGVIQGSTHHHRFCHKGGKVCGNVTEVIADLMLGRLIGNETDRLLGSSGKRRNVTICTDCPASLLPFHIKVKPDLSCTDQMVERNSSNLSWGLRPCPASCLVTPPVGVQDTQSGPVDVRVCS